MISQEQIFGYVCDEVIGQNITILMPKEYRDRHLAGLQRYCKTGKGNVVGKAIDVTGLRKNGDEFPMELSINVVMPNMGGVEMLRKIRSINSRIPTIFMTGYDQGKIHLRRKEQYNTLILSKPLQIPELSQHIESILKQ